MNSNSNYPFSISTYIFFEQTKCFRLKIFDNFHCTKNDVLYKVSQLKWASRDARCRSQDIHVEGTLHASYIIALLSITSHSKHLWFNSIKMLKLK